MSESCSIENIVKIRFDGLNLQYLDEDIKYKLIILKFEYLNIIPKILEILSIAVQVRIL